MCFKLEHAKLQRSIARKTFLNWGLNGGEIGNSIKNGTVRYRAKVTINH